MEHPSEIIGYEGQLERLADEISGLKPIVMSKLLTLLGDDLDAQADADSAHGRKKLSRLLSVTADSLYKAGQDLWIAGSDLSLDGAMDIPGYENHLETLAKGIGIMRYDRVAELIGIVADGVHNRSSEGASSLFHVAGTLRQAQEEMIAAWKICEPYVNKR